MSDAVSSIQLGVGTTDALTHLRTLREAFQGLRTEMEQFNATKSGVEALTSGAGAATSAIDKLTAELEKSKREAQGLRTLTDNLAKANRDLATSAQAAGQAQADSAKDVTKAVTTAATQQTKVVTENLEKQVAATEAAEKAKAAAVEEGARRFKRSQSEKVGRQSVSMSESSTEAEFDKAVRLAAAERDRVQTARYTTASPRAQLARVNEAVAYGNAGGNVKERFGSAVEIDTNAAGVARLKAEVEKLTGATHGAAQKQREMNELWREGHSLARGIAGPLGAMWLTWGSIVPLLAGATIAAGLKEAITGFMDVQYQMTFVKELTMNTTDSVAELSHQMHEVGKALGISPEEAGKGLRALTQAGLDTDKALTALPDVFKLATVGELSVGSAALAAVGAMNTFKMGVYDLGKIGDVMAKAGALSATSVTSMTESMKVAGPVAAQFGVDINETAMALTALAKVNITGSAGGTAFKNFLQESGAPSSKKARGLREMLGLDAYEAGGEKLKPIIQQIEELRTVLSNYTPKSQGMILNTLYGQKGEKEVFSLLQQGTDESKKILDQLKNSEGFNTNVFMKLQMSAHGQLELLQADVTHAFAAIGEAMDAPLKEGTRALREAFNSKDLQSSLLGLAQSFITIGTAAVTYGPPIIAIYAVWKTSALVAAGVTALGVAMEGLAVSTLSVGAAIRGVTALLSTVAPWVRIISLVATLAAGYLLLRERKDSVSEATIKELSDIKEVVKQMDAENERLEKRNELRAKGVRTENLDKQIQLSDAQAKVDKLATETDRLNGVVEKERSEKGKGMLSAAANAAGQQAKVNAAKLAEAKQDLAAIDAQVKRNQSAQEKARELDAKDAAAREAERKKNMPSGSKVYNPDEKKTNNNAANNDAMHEQINAIKQRLEGEQKLIKLQERTDIQRNKRGEIGDIELLNDQRDNAIAKERNLQKAAEDQIAVYARYKNQLGNITTERGKITNSEEAEVAAEITYQEKLATLVEQYADDTTKAQAENMKRRGELVAAYLLETEGKYRKSREKMLEDLNNPTVMAKVAPEQRAVLEQKVASIDNAQASGVLDAQFQQVKNKYDALYAEMEARIEAINNNAANAGDGGSLIAAAAQADEIRGNLIPALAELQGAMAQIAKMQGSDALIKEATNYGKNLGKEADRSAQQWKTAANAIAKSLEDAFGRGGKAVGGLVKAYVQYSSQKKDIDDKLAKNETDKTKGYDEYIKTKEALESESTQATLNNYANMAGAAAGFFKENSKGYETLHTMEQAFRAVQMALQVKDFLYKMFANTTVTAAKVQGDIAQASSAVQSAGVQAQASMVSGQASALSGVANQAKGDPYSAWIRMAAMAATMAALGYAVSTSGSQHVDVAKEAQKRQGTGTVLGDMGDPNDSNNIGAKSESVKNSLSLLKDNSDIALTHTSKMLTALVSIDSSMKGLANIIFRTAGVTTGSNMGIQTGKLSSNTGDPILGMFGFNDSSFTKNLPIIGGIVSKLQSLWGNTSQSIVDSGLQVKGSMQDLMGGTGVNQYAEVERKQTSWFGLVKDFSYSTQYQEASSEIAKQFAKIFQGVNTAVSEAAGALGRSSTDVKRQLESLAIDMGNVSLKNLKGQELEDAINGVISKASDQIAMSALPGLEEFQRIGEGYFQTAIRVSSGMEKAEYALAKLGMTVGNVRDIADKQGDADVEMVRLQLLRKETTRRVESTGPSITDFNLRDDLSGVGAIIRDMHGSVEELADAYKKLIDVRSSLKMIGLNGNGMTRDMIYGAGGLDELQAGMKDYLDGMFTETEKAQFSIVKLKEQFSAIGLVMPKSNEEFKKLVSGLDLTTESGQKLFGKLVTLSGEFAKVTEATGTTSQALAKLRGSVTSKKYEADTTTYVDYATRWMDVKDSALDMFEAVDQAVLDVKKSLLGQFSGGDLTTDQKAAKAALTADLQGMQAAQEARMQKKVTDLWAEFNAAGVTPEQQLDLAGKLKDAILSRYQLEQENSKKLIDTAKQLKGYLDSLLTGDLSPLTNAGKLDAAQGQYNNTLVAAKGGDETAMGELQNKAQTYLEQARNFYASSDAYKSIFSQVTGELGGFSDKALQQGEAGLTDAQKQLDELSRLQTAVSGVEDQAKKAYDNAVSQLAAALAMQQAMEATLGVTSTLPQILRDLPAGLAGALAAQGILNKAPLGATPEPLAPIAAMAQAEAAQPASSTNSVDTSVYGGKAITGGDNVYGISYGLSFGHAKGLDFVPYDDYKANLHKGERVLTAAATSRMDAGQAELLAEVAALRHEVAALRSDQRQQTGDLIRSNFEANDAAAEKVVDGHREAADNAAWKQTSMPTLV